MLFSVCYQAIESTAVEGPCNLENGGTSLTMGSPPESVAVAAVNHNVEVSSHAQHVESGTSPCQKVVSFMEDCVSGGQHVNGSSYFVEEAPKIGSIGIFTPVQQRPSPMSVYSFSPPMSLALPPAPRIPPCVPLVCPNPPSTHPQQALSVNAHKHFHPQFGWKEHISRALLVSGIPPYLTESQLRAQLEQWGHIRALHTDRLSQGVLSVHFFDLRASRQALRDIQNQHLLRQQRFQEHLYAQSGMQFQNYSFKSGAAEQGLSSRGLLSGHVVWAQYIAAWSVPVPDGHNQGTLVLFNVGADVNIQRLQQVFEKYGYVRELREAPTKRQHKFVEFYDTRDAEAAWAALNGQEVCGKCVKIEFSRQGGLVRKQKLAPVVVCKDLVAIGHEAVRKDCAYCGWQNHSPNGYHRQEWHANFFEYDPPPFPRSDNVLSSLNTRSGEDDCSHHASSIANELCETGGKEHVHHKQGAIAGPRRKRSTLRPHPKVHVFFYGKDSAFTVRPAGAIQRVVSTRDHPHFEYDEREVYLVSGQPRTTVMIKNIPNKYSQQMLLALLDHHCAEHNSQIQDVNEPESAYDFVYLPIDFKNRCNLGYAFVNFTSALANLKFYKAFHSHAWEEFNSRKICEIKYARVQGRQALENHFCNSRFACDKLEYLPVVFVPPRNGLQCPPPKAAAGLKMMESIAGRVLLGSPSCGGGRGGGAAASLSPSQSLPESQPSHEAAPSLQ